MSVTAFLGVIMIAYLEQIAEHIGLPFWRQFIPVAVASILWVAYNGLPQ